MNEQDHADIVEIFRAVARIHVLPRFRRLAPGDIAMKSGPTDLVTLADTEAEAALTKAILHRWPEVRVIGEEAVSADPGSLAGIAAAPRSVILDPVDGTWNFARGLALFGMICAIAERGRPVYGLIYDPVLDDWVEASTDGPARMVMADGTTNVLATSTEARLPRMSGYIPLGLMPAAVKPGLAALFPDFGRVTSLRCSAHEYRMVAQGHVEFCLAGSLNPWDHAAGALAVQQAGGVARMLDGQAYDVGLTEGWLLSAGSEDIWGSVAERLMPVLG